MIGDLNSIERDSILKLLLELIKRLEKLEAEVLRLAKRIQVLENP